MSRIEVKAVAPLSRADAGGFTSRRESSADSRGDILCGYTAIVADAAQANADIESAERNFFIICGQKETEH